MSTQRVIIRFRAGPTWQTGSVREQPDWDAHAEFVDRLVERGIFVMGGPFADNSGSLSIYEGVDEAEARAIVSDDPFLHNGVFELEDVRAWDVFVDELSA